MTNLVHPSFTASASKHKVVCLVGMFCDSYLLLGSRCDDNESVLVCCFFLVPTKQ
jgi:hypothetical protein